MLGTLIKTIAYTKKPKLTFAALHPEATLRMAKVPYDLRHAYAPRMTAVLAAAAALPLGMLLGRRMRGSAAPSARTARRERMRMAAASERTTRRSRSSRASA